MLRARKIVFILLSAFLVCIAAYASAAQDRTNDFQLIISVELTKLNGEALPSPIPRGQEFRLKYHFSIPNVLHPQLSPGDTYYLQIPPEILVQAQEEPEDLMQGTTKLAEWQVISGNIIKVTFTEKIAALSNRAGQFWLDLGFNTETIGDGGETRLDFDLGFSHNQPIDVVFEEPPVSPPDVLKTGTYLKESNEILWKINIQPKGQLLRNYVIRDMIPEHTAFVDGSIRYNNGTTLPTYLSWTLDGRLLEIRLNATLSSGFNVSFKTRVLDSALEGLESGQVALIDNQAIVGFHEGSTHTEVVRVPVSVEYAHKTGKHDSINKTITWTAVVNPQGHAISNVTFKDTLPEGLSYVVGSMSPMPAGGVTVNGQVISAVLGNLTAPLKLTYVTSVQDELYMGGSQTLTNKLEIGKDGGPPGNTSTSAGVTVSGAGNIRKSGPVYSSSYTYPAGYDPATGTITWIITVNESRVPLLNPVITDLLADEYHDLVPGSVSVSGLPEGVTSSIAYDNGTRGFTVSVNGTVSTTFTVTMKTKLRNPQHYQNNYAPADASTAKWPKNTVTLKVGDLVQSDEAVAYVRSIVLSKEADGSFNHETREIKYKLTVNRNKNTLSDVVIKEKLGRPLLFKAGSLMFSDNRPIPEGPGDTTPYYIFHQTPGDPNYSGVLEIHLGNISTTQTLSLTGKINMDDPKAMDFFLKPGNKTLINRATLTHNDLPDGTPEVKVDTPIRTSVVEKTGTAPENGAYIDWKVTINKSNLGMDGFVLTDQLPEGLALDSTQLTLHKLNISETGAVTVGDSITLTGDNISYDHETRLLTFTMPASDMVENGAYRLDFRTIVVSGIQGNYSNNATLKFSKGVATSNTSTVKTQWQGSGGNAWGEVGVLALTKVEEGKPAHFLQGAKFVLYDHLNIKVADIETDEQGKASFDLLRFDIPYTIKEIQPPAGFVSGLDEEGKTIILPSNDPDKIIEISLENGRVGGYKDITATKVWSGWPDGTDLPAVYLRLMWRLEEEAEDQAGWVPDNMFAFPETAVKMAVRDPVTGVWQVTWKDLPANDLAGKQYVYLVKEVDSTGDEFIPTDADHFYTKKEEGLQVTNTVSHKKTRISKTEVNGTVELPGATLRVYKGKTTDTLVEEWESTDTVKVIDLLPGIYTLVEITAPQGYELAESITFRVNLDGTVEIKDGIEWAPTINATVRMEDALSEQGVKISKTAVNGTEELPGATLRVYKGETTDTLVEEWVSTDTVKSINLLPGIYTLVEITAPQGYELAESITFRVNLDGTVEIKDGVEWISAANAMVRMEDALTPVSDTPTPEPTPSYDTLRVPLTARKTLRNSSLKAGDFTFVLKDGAGRVIAEASNDQSGLIVFSDRTFSRVVTNYLYTIEEKQGTAADITYDQTVFTVKVTTRAVEGRLVAQVDILRDGVPYAGEVHFVNTRKAPATGDGMMHAILALFTFSSVLLGGSFLMRRRKETPHQG